MRSLLLFVAAALAEIGGAWSGRPHAWPASP
jgi:drug/metabolite transporter superfamily protein YnfA